MSVTDLGMLGYLKSKMNWHQARQRVLAENVSNSDTPRYKPRELKAPDFKKTLSMTEPVRVSTTLTHKAHLAVASSSANSDRYASSRGEGWETTPGGNAVVLEEQMMKIAENQYDYQLVSTIYSRSLGLIKTALGRNG